MKYYTYQAYQPNIDNQIKTLIKEGLGIRSIGRVLNISPKTVIERTKKIAAKINPPAISSGKTYELDELCTYLGVKSKRIWVAYSICKETNEIVCLKVGTRTNQTLRTLTNKLIDSSAKRIYTDKLRNYKHLIPQKIHNTRKYGTNHIERMNLNLRTHLKRLNRKTICYSKRLNMLECCLKIYFWS